MQRVIATLNIQFIIKCAQYGCLLELTFQLIVIFALKQTLNNIKELGVPLVKVGIRELFSIFQNKKKGTRQETQRAWERDRKLEAEEETGLFEDYLELGESVNTNCYYCC